VAFWPDVEACRRVEYGAEAVWADGPSYSDLLVALRPALRGLFLLGHRTTRLEIATDASGQWSSIDPASLERETVERTDVAPPASGLMVRFETVTMADPFHAGSVGYAVPSAATELAYADLSDTKGKLPAALVGAIEAFVEDQLTELVGRIGADGFVREPEGGLGWIFDPTHWRGLGDAGVWVAEGATGGSHEGLLRASVFDERGRHTQGGGLYPRRAPTLRWLLGAGSRARNPSDFAWAVDRALAERGQAHALWVSRRGILFSRKAPSWLDVLIELLFAGAFFIDGLIAPLDPVEPIVAYADENEPVIELVVWGETTITLRRVTPNDTKTTLEGSVAWDYRHGDAKTPPRVILVAGRGVGVDLGSYRDRLPWKLDVYRVQDDAKIPPHGAAIQPALFMSPSRLDPSPEEIPPGTFIGTNTIPRVAAKPKPDGLYLEFPCWGENIDGFVPGEIPETVALGTTIPFGLDLTVDPRSGTDGYLVDAHYYTYQPMEGYAPVVGVHLCIWATEGVRIRSSGSPIGAPFDFLAHAVGLLGRFPAYKITAELWKVDRLQYLPRPFELHAQVTDSLAGGATFHESVLHFAETNRHVMYEGEYTLEIDSDGGAAHNILYTLTPHGYSHQTFRYEDSLFLDFIDLVVGFLPFIGDIADIAETSYAWATGHDKWGRPLTNFDLALMTVGTAVPFVGASFLRKVAGSLPADEKLVRSKQLTWLTRRAADKLPVDEKQVEAMLSVSPAWHTDRRLKKTAGKAEMTDAALRFLRENDALIEALADRFVTRSGAEWLSLADVLKQGPNGPEFLLGPMQDGYKRWKKTHPWGTPEGFIEHGLSGRAKVMAEALLGPTNVAGSLRRARRAVRKAKVPSAHGRLPKGGVGVRVREVTATEWGDHVEDFIQEAMDPASEVSVVFAGGLHRVHEITDVDPGFLADGARQLLAAADGAGDLKPLLGGDKSLKKLISAEERGARFAMALFAAAAELKAHNIDPAVLFKTDALPATSEYVRNFIMRGWENGARFEVRLVARFESLPRGTYDAAVHQLKLPTLLGKKPLSGPDSVVFRGGEAVLVQLKAYRYFEDLVDGRLVLRWRGGKIVGVEGPGLLEQVVKDAVRLKHWDFKVPGKGVPVPADGKLPPDLTGWWDVADHHVLYFDDAYLRDRAFELVSSAQRKVGRNEIDLLTDIDAPKEVRQLLVDKLGNPIDMSDADALDELLETWVVHMTDDIQDRINATMRSLKDHFDGRVFTYEVRRGTEEVSGI